MKTSYWLPAAEAPNGGAAKFDSPSLVVETISPISSTLSSLLVVCFGGEIFEVEGDLETVIWKNKITLSSKPFSTPARICHATYHQPTQRLFVVMETNEQGSESMTFNDESLPNSIYVADLATVMLTGSQWFPVEISPFFEEKDNTELCRVDGVAVDDATDLLFVCDENNSRICIWPISGQRESGARAKESLKTPSSLCRLRDQSFHPFRCATFPKKELTLHPVTTCQLAVADYRNSQVYIFEIIARRRPIGTGKTVTHYPESITSTLVQVLSNSCSDMPKMLWPRGVAFDPVGNLIVSDYGNCKIQMFSKRFVNLNKRQHFYRPGKTLSTSPSSIVAGWKNQSLSFRKPRPALKHQQSAFPDDNFTGLKLVSVWQSDYVARLRSACVVMDPERRLPTLVAVLYSNAIERIEFT